MSGLSISGSNQWTHEWKKITPPHWTPRHKLGAKNMYRQATQGFEKVFHWMAFWMEAFVFLGFLATERDSPQII